MSENQKKKTHRVERMNDMFREAIAKYMIYGPGSALGFVTITRVKATPDLGKARVSFTAMGTLAENKKTLITLRKSAKEIRYHLAQELNLRNTPELEFFYDDELEEAYKLERVFYDIQQKEKLIKAEAEDGDKTETPEPVETAETSDIESKKNDEEN